MMNVLLFLYLRAFKIKKNITSGCWHTVLPFVGRALRMKIMSNPRP